MNINAFARAFAQGVEQAGGRAVIVGGAPRDLFRQKLGSFTPFTIVVDPEATRLIDEKLKSHLRSTCRTEISTMKLMGSPAAGIRTGRVELDNPAFKDLDFEVYGLDIEKVGEILGRLAPIKEVGRSFGVFKVHVDGIDIDVSLPRTESKNGKGHRGFTVDLQPDITPAQAARRRDFTINSLAFDPLTWTLYDFHGGFRDATLGILRHVSSAFGEDPLRVLRGMQFRSRFNLEYVPKATVQICQSLRPEFFDLAKERVWTEWEKLATKSVRPSLGLDFLYQTEWIGAFPELFDLTETPQNPDWHPEGTAWDHTLQAVDAAQQIAFREQLSAEDRVVLIFAAMCHDMGKPWRTTFEDGVIKSHGHDEASDLVAIRFLESIHAPERVVGAVAKLVRKHHAHLNDVTPRSVRRLARFLEQGDEPDGTARDRYRPHSTSIEMLALLMEADHSGRYPLPGGIPEKTAQILNLARKLSVEQQAEKEILMGRHLIEFFGLPPTPEIGRILKLAKAAQEDGVFYDLPGAIAWVETVLRIPRKEQTDVPSV